MALQKRQTEQTQPAGQKTIPPRTLQPKPVMKSGVVEGAFQTTDPVVVERLFARHITANCLRGTEVVYRYSAKQTAEIQAILNAKGTEGA